MKRFSYSAVAHVIRECMWAVWEDVLYWNRWNYLISKSSLHGNFEVSSKGVLTLKKGPQLHFKIIALEEWSHFTFMVKLPLTHLIFHHFLEQDEDFLVVNHSLKIMGVGWPFYAYSLGQPFKKVLPEMLQKCVHIAEKEYTFNRTSDTGS